MYILYIFIFLFIILSIINNKTADVICPAGYNVLSTGSSSNHFNLLILMIYRLYRKENNICVVVWDLGLSSSQYDLMIKEEKYISIIRNDIIFFNYKFNYSNYPSHFNINNNAGCYAWKPFVIYNTYKLFKRHTLWLDAGCYIKNKLKFEYNEIKRKKFWSPGSKTKILKYTNKNLFKILDADAEIYNKSMCAGGIIGVYYSSNIVNKIFQLWKACAIIKKCISPEGSNIKNHRYDQSIISILLHKNNLSCEGAKGKNYITHFDSSIKNYNDSNYLHFIKSISV